MRATVTGATGYIGQRLVERLVREGWSVLALVQPGDTVPLAPGVLRLEDTGTTPGDTAILKEFVPDVVLHLAACQDLSDGPEAVDRLIEANVAFGARVLEAAASSGARGVVAAGTFMAHADGTPDYAPQTLYAATKQAFSDLAAHYSRWRMLRVTVLELSDTYGPGDDRPKFLNLLASACHTGKTLDVTPGHQTVYPLHVDDVVDAFVFAATQAGRGYEFADTYTVRGPSGVTIRELVEIFARATGRRPPVRFGGRPYRRNEIMCPFVGPSIPGWAPLVPLERGLREVFGSGSIG